MKSVHQYHLAVFATLFVLGGVCFHIVVHFAGTVYPHAKWFAVAVGVLFLALGATAFYLGRGVQSRVLIGLLVMAWLPAFFAGSIFGSIVVKTPAVGRGRQKRSVADIARIGRNFEAYRAEHGLYPTVRSVDHLRKVLREDLPVVDGWGYPLMVESNSDHYVIVGFGKRGEPDDPAWNRRGATHDLEADVVLTDNGWQQFPEGMEIPTVADFPAKEH